MAKKAAFTITLITIPIVLLVSLMLFGTFYSYWNSAAPEKTCASCHEIGKSVNMFTQSSHRKFKCKECHGTALTQGFHSLREKGMMVVNHLKDKSVEDIKLNEEQILEVMDNCIRCHSAEYSGWVSGGHSARYSDIFLNEKHNSAELINFDCLRCHGMFNAFPVTELVEPLNKTGPWKFKRPGIADQPVIPCMACHQVHNKGVPGSNPDYSDPHGIFYTRVISESKVSFYNRQDKSTIPIDLLPQLTLWEGNRQVDVSDDLIMRNCIQCHAPNSRHQAGSSDDRTPRGVHEGLHCTACHEPHSNDARQSCINCHPFISNCNLDVTKMNTSFADHDSPNNIHWVSCTDCHKSGVPERK